jgi:uncharacterized protein YgiM (DUF1202 family)
MCCGGTLHAASAVLSGLDLVGSAKGVALALKADAPFPIKMEEKTSSRNPQQMLLAVHCSNVIYGLEDFEFASFPPGCPVQRIAVSESPAGNSIDMVFVIAGSLDKPVVSKQKGSRWIILLSHESTPDFSWSASPQAKPAPAVEKPRTPVQQSGMSRLTDISVLVRDKVELLTFAFDGSTTVRFRRDRDRIVVLFVNTTSGLPATRLSPTNDPRSAIELKQMAHGGTMWLGASVFMSKQAMASALMQEFPGKLVIYTVRDSLQGLSLWSAASGQSVSYDFAKLPRFEVDIEGMKKKVLSDMSSDLSKGKTFAIHEETAKKQAEGAPAPPSAVPEKPQAAAVLPAAAAPPVKKAPVIVRLIVTKDSAKLRSDPVVGNNVTAKLPAGTVGAQIEKKREWVKMQTDAATGWVSSSAVADSAHASRAVFAAIEKIGRQRLAQQKAAEEKAAREQAAKEKAEQEKLAKEKLVKDREAQKKAVVAAQAAARDSAVRQAAVEQDSVQAAKSFRSRKLVEYHVFGRDPFLPISNDEEGPVPNVENLTLVGILYDQADRIALFESSKASANSKAYALRENDPVRNGYVLRIQPDKVLFLLNELGISRTYAMKLTREKEK